MLSNEVALLARILLSQISMYVAVMFDVDNIPSKWLFPSATGIDFKFLSLIMFQAIFNETSGANGAILSISKSSTFSLTVSKN